MHRLRAATAYNLQKSLSCTDRPKANVKILTQKQANILYFALRYVVQHLGKVVLTQGLFSHTFPVLPYLNNNTYK